MREGEEMNDKEKAALEQQKEAKKEEKRQMIGLILQVITTFLCGMSWGVLLVRFIEWMSR